MKPPSRNLRSIAIIGLPAGLVLIAGFTAIVTVFFRGESKESSAGLNVNAVNASPVDHTAEVKVNSNNPGGKPLISADNVGSIGIGVTGGNPDVTVWVNTSSGVYHCANTRWYGNTKSGKYMSQQEAQSKGYRPAHGSMCG